MGVMKGSEVVNVFMIRMVLLNYPEIRRRSDDTIGTAWMKAKPKIRIHMKKNI
jgi:hypothetical protein